MKQFTFATGKSWKLVFGDALVEAKWDKTDAIPGNDAIPGDAKIQMVIKTKFPASANRVELRT